MALTVEHYRSLIPQIASKLQGAAFNECYPLAPGKFVLSFSSGQLLVSLQPAFVRCHLLSEKSEASGFDPFAEKITKVLSGAIVQKIELCNDDRIISISLSFGNKHFELLWELFPRSPNGYLLDSEKSILAMYRLVDKQKYFPPDKPSPRAHQGIDIGSKITNESIEKYFQDKEKEAFFAHDKQQVESWINQRLKRLEKLKGKYQQEYDQCQRWPEIQHEAMLLQANFFRLKRGMKSIAINDWENDQLERLISLDPLLDPQEELAKRFKQVRKLKNGIEPIQKMIVKTQHEIDSISPWFKEIIGLMDYKSLNAFKKRIKFPEEKTVTTSKPKVKPAEPFYTYVSQSGLPIFVGKNARGNDTLTFQHAHGSDWWLHAAGEAGSHVVLRTHKGQEPDSEALMDAMQLALHYSKAKERGEGEVSITQKKYVTRYGSAAGKVQLSKHKHVFIKSDPGRIQQIKSRKKD